MRTEILTAAVTPVDTQANVAFLWNFQVAELLSANNFHMALWNRDHDCRNADSSFLVLILHRSSYGTESVILSIRRLNAQPGLLGLENLDGHGDLDGNHGSCCPASRHSGLTLQFFGFWNEIIEVVVAQLLLANNPRCISGNFSHGLCEKSEHVILQNGECVTLQPGLLGYFRKTISVQPKSENWQLGHSELDKPSFGKHLVSWKKLKTCN